MDPRLLSDIAAMHGSSGSGRRVSVKASDRALPLNKPFGGAPRFVASAKTAASLPAESVPEVAFIGRSNGGKSSLLNALTGMRSLAKVSEKPGKTQALNFFEAGKGKGTFHMVDMPVTASRSHAIRTCRRGPS